MALLIDRSLEQIEQALLETAILGLKARIGSVADLDTLRAIPAMGSSGTPVQREYALYYVTSEGNVFWWKQASALADDGATVIKPVDVTTTGRWTKATSSVIFEGDNIATIETGILRNVILHNGDFSIESLNKRIFAHRPCLAIHFLDEEHKPISQINGALYDYRVKFELWSVTRNYRDENEAALGSDVAAELAIDPGVLRVHGKVKKLFTGETLGNPGIKLINPTEGRLELGDQEERVFVMALGIEIFGSIHNPEAAKEIRAIDGIDVQRYTSQANAAKVYSESNMVTLGLYVNPGTGYSKAVAAGTAVIDGAPVTVLEEIHAFSDSMDTYRDLSPLGEWTFVEVARNQTPPDPASGFLRVGLTVTDSAGVACDSYLCSVSIISEDADQITLT